MGGIVTVIRGEEIIENSANMILDGMGSVLADAMTVSPSLSSINSASAILDASNYTIQAISFGKDARGFFNHAHAVPDHVSSVVATDNKIRVCIPTDSALSSYITSDVTTYRRTTDTGRGLSVSDGQPYKLLPEPSNPEQVKLESRFFGMPISPSFDIGHNPNTFWDHEEGLAFPYLNALSGCWPAPDGSDYYMLSSFGTEGQDIDSYFVFSGTASSVFNTVKSMDKLGFVKLSVSSAHQGRQKGQGAAQGPYSGLCIYAEDDFSSTGKVSYIITVSGGDLVFAGCFGGIYTIGLWAIDIKGSLANGATAPFIFDHANNLIKYKLVARKTFTKDLTWITDVLGFSGYKFLEDRYDGLFGNTNFLVIKWELQF